MTFYEMVHKAKAKEEEIIENDQLFGELVTQKGKNLIYPTILVLFQFIEDLDVNYHIFKHNNMYQGTLYRGRISEPEDHFTSNKHEDLKAVLFEMVMHEGFKVGWNSKNKSWFKMKKKSTGIVV